MKDKCKKSDYLPLAFTRAEWLSQHISFIQEYIFEHVFYNLHRSIEDNTKSYEDSEKINKMTNRQTTHVVRFGMILCHVDHLSAVEGLRSEYWWIHQPWER